MKLQKTTKVMLQKILIVDVIHITTCERKCFIFHAKSTLNQLYYLLNLKRFKTGNWRNHAYVDKPRL